MRRKVLSGLAGLALFGCGGDPSYEPRASPQGFISGPQTQSPEAPLETKYVLQACVDRHGPRLPSDSYAILFDLEATRSGGITSVKIKDSMVSGSEVEQCLANALKQMNVPAAMNTRQGVTPQSRSLPGIIQAAAAPIALLPIALVAGGVTILLGVTVYVATEALKDTAHCKEVKEDCIVACNGKLPTGDFGFRFWNCVNRCMRTAGC